jgi:hypothetical protein
MLFYVKSTSLAAREVVDMSPAIGIISATSFRFTGIFASQGRLLARWAFLWGGGCGGVTPFSVPRPVFMYAHVVVNSHAIMDIRDLDQITKYA